MFWGGVFMGFILIFVCILKSSLLVFWKGLIWFGLNLSESLSFFNSTLILVVSVIVFHALLFSGFYMLEETSSSGFLLVMMLFVGSMIILISSDSLFALFLGWDGLGVSSFFLVIWYQTWNSWDSGMITFLSNRLGDFFLIFSTISYFSFGWVSESEHSSLGFSLLFILACFTKSAQVPFMVWLPMAMSAPTPISALVHSSTLVTAGLLMALKLSSFILAKVFLLFGGLTMLTAGGISLFEMDLKKVVALSTLSQLGFMGVGLGAGIFSLTLFHMMSHAFIKSSFFILVGVLLHINFSSQDKRLMRVFSSGESFCLSGLVVCSLALCGLGFTSGLVSKEALLLQQSSFYESSIIFLSFLLVVSFTFIYCGRLLTVGAQNILNVKGSQSMSMKMTSGSALLLWLSVTSAWGFSDSLIFVSGMSSGWEKSIPILMMIWAYLIWKMTPQWKLIFSSFGWGVSFSQSTKSLINTSKKDRELVDQSNWASSKWLDYIFSSFMFFYKGAYFVFYFILASLILL